jgi:hypothetical protein
MCSKDFSVNLKAVETSERIGEEIRRGFVDSKHRDGVPNFMHAFNQKTFTHEDEQIVAAAGTSDQALHHYFTSISGLPDVDGVENFVKRLLSSSWVGKRTSQHSLALSYFRCLPLASLRSLKGFFSSWDSDVEMLWLQEVIARLAPAAHVDMSINLEALTEYCNQVWAVLDSTSLAARTANNMRTVIAFQRVTLAYNEAGQSWSSKGCQDALLAFFRIPMRGFKWEVNDAKGFFGQISADMWLRNAAYAHNLSEQSCLAITPVSVQEMERVIGDALTSILGADTKAKPGSNLSPWSKYCSDAYLKAVQAIGRVTAGDDPTVWEKALGEHGYRAEVPTLEKLRSLVELRFSDANRDYFAATEDAAIAFVSKGVPSVQVKLYELNTNSYYIDKLEEIPSDLALDGLLPFEAIPFDFQATAKSAAGGWSPFKRQIVSVALPPLVGTEDIPRRGVFIVEVTGGGTSVRAVIRKGALRFVERTTIGGHVLTVLDEFNRPLPANRVSVHFAGRRYATSPANVGKANETDILIPFAASETTAPLVLTLEGEEQQEGGVDNSWSFSTLISSWTCKHEWYTLEAAMHVERESLVKDNYGAQLLVRPKLLLHGHLPAPLAALVDVSLNLSSTDAEGNTSSRVFRPMVISSESETALSFAVPQGLRSLSATMSASVEILAVGSRSQLAVTHTLAVNGIEGTNDTRDFFLRKDTTHGYVLYVLGKTGEPVGNTSISLTLGHTQLTVAYTETVTTSPLGAIRLGPLDSYCTVTAYDTSNGRSASFDLPQDTGTFPTAIHTSTAGDGGAFDAAANPASTKRRAVQAVLPFRPTLKAGENPTKFKLSSRDLSVVEVRSYPGASSDGTRPIVDVLASASSRAAHATYDAGSGFLLLHDLPAGQYEVTLKRPYPGCTAPPATITIRVLQAVGATVVNGYIASGNLLLEARNITPTGNGAATIPECPVQIASINVESVPGSEPQVAIRVSGGRHGPGPAASKDVRVHVFATFFVSTWDAGAAFARLSLPHPSYKTCAPPLTRYLGSRTLSEEIKYVLDRQAALASDAPPLPGNLLPRPSLLINPWSLGTADTEVQEAKGGSEFARHRDAAYNRGGGGGAAVATRQVLATEHNRYMCMDFLSRPSVTLANLRPDANGVVHIPLSQLATAGYDRTADWDLSLTVVAVDAWSTAATTAPITLPKAVEATRGAPFRDLTRSGSFLPLDTHVVHSSKSSVLAPAGDSLVINSAGTFVKVEPYGSLDKVFSFFAAHSSSSGSLTTEWGWLLQWPTLNETEKRTRYSKYACHEMHVWLYFKDQPFFDTVVRPFLLFKRSKTFVDHWVLGEDVSAYAAPYAFCRLNAFEQALLAARTPSAAVAAAIAGDLKDAVENNPTSFSDMDTIFKAALASDGLSATAAPIPLPSPPPPPSATLAMMIASTRDAYAGFGGPPGGSRGPPPPAAPMSLSSRQPRAAAPVSRSRGGGGNMKSKRKERVEEDECDMPCSMDEISYDRKEVCAEMACMDDEEDISYDMPSSEVMRRSDDADLSTREVARQAAVYRPLDKTEEFAEANYYRIRAEADNASMIATNEFWRDFAAYCARVHGLQEEYESSRDPLAAAIAHNPFVSASFGVIALNTKGSNANFNEMLLALAVLGLPFECSTDASPSKPAVSSMDGGARIRYTSTGTPLVVFHQDLSPVNAVASTTVLCGQNYFDPSDRYFTEKGIRRERYLPVCTTTGAGQPAMELLVGRVYGCMVVITNVSPEHQQLEALLQIPQGAMPASNGFFSRTQLVDLAPFATRRLEYLFYFPRTGDFGHYPVHVGSGGELLAHANVIYTKVTRRPTVHRDTTSWQYLSVHASLAELLTYLQHGNLQAVDLSRILWRCREEATYRQLIALFRSRGHFYDPLWAYGFAYGDARAIKESLNRPAAASILLNNRLLGDNSVGFTSPLITIAGEEGVGPDAAGIADIHPVLRQYNNYSYEHLEYSPLVNARAHVLGKKRTLLNKAVERQYRRLLVTLCIKPRFAIAPADLLAVVYHLLLQDRVNEALQVFSLVPPPLDSTIHASNTTHKSSSSSSSSANWLTIQYDYMAAYLDFFRVHASSPLLATAAAVTSSSPLSSPASAPPPAATGPYTFPVATTVAAAYKDYPVPKWAAKFREVAQQIEEARRSEVIRSDAIGTIGSHTSSFETETSKELSREAQQSKAVSREPSLELAVESGEAIITFSNLTSAVLRFYSMDVELLFSTSPFFSGKATGTGTSASLGKFAFVRPNGVLPLALPAVPPGKVFEARFPLPDAFKDKDTMVEVISSQASIRRAVPYFANKLNVSVTESFGRLKVTAAGTGAPLPRTYVKVYTRTSEGDKGKFYKDGYTDLRGVFDYVSLSSASGGINRFAVLTVSDKHGSSITTAAPPGV